MATFSSPADFINVCLVQSGIHEAGTEATLHHLEETIWSNDSKPDLIILPEMFATGYTMAASIHAQHENMGIFRWMRQMAAQTNAVICGSIAIKEGAKYYNRLIWMRPDGSYEAYNKKHLFTFAGEDKVYTAGNTRLITTLLGWKICPLICYDLRFPVWSRSHNLEYDLLIYCAAWPMARVSAWSSLLPARAIENMAYTIGVNACSTFEGTLYGGHSAIIHPKGDTMFAADTTEQMTNFRLSYSEMEHYRLKFPAWKDADEFEIKDLK